MKSGTPNAEPEIQGSPNCALVMVTLIIAASMLETNCGRPAIQNWSGDGAKRFLGIGRIFNDRLRWKYTVALVSR